MGPGPSLENFLGGVGPTFADKFGVAVLHGCGQVEMSGAIQ